MKKKRGKKEAWIPRIKRTISSYISEEKASINKHTLLSLGAFLAAGVIASTIVKAATVTVVHNHSDIGHSNCSHTSCSHGNHSSCSHGSHVSCGHSSHSSGGHTSCGAGHTSHTSCGHTNCHASCSHAEHSSCHEDSSHNIDPAHEDSITVSTT